MPHPWNNHVDKKKTETAAFHTGMQQFFFSKDKARHDKMNHFQRLNEVKELENFLFRATREYTEANIKQAIVATRRLGANSPEPCKRAVREWHVSTQKTGSYKTERSRLPGLIVGPCPSEESLCCPACPPPPPFFFADSRPPISKVRVLFPCICSPTVCIINTKNYWK